MRCFDGTRIPPTKSARGQKLFVWCEGMAEVALVDPVLEQLPGILSRSIASI
jgi:hypothetical protein